MIHLNEEPQTPDWAPSPGNTCAGCLASWNLCASVHQVSDQTCCSACSHPAKAEAVVLGWDGDQA